MICYMTTQLPRVSEKKSHASLWENSPKLKDLSSSCSLSSQLLKHTHCWSSLPAFSIRTILSGCTINKGWWHLGTRSRDTLQPLQCLEKNTASCSLWLCSDHIEYEGKTRSSGDAVQGPVVEKLSGKSAQGDRPVRGQPCTPPGCHNPRVARGCHCALRALSAQFFLP